MSYKDLQTTVIDLEYEQDPNEFWEHLFIIIILVSYIDNTILFLCDVAVWTLMNLYMDKIILRYNKS